VPESQTWEVGAYACASPKGNFEFLWLSLIALEGRGLAIFPLLGVADTTLNYPKLGKNFSFCEGRCKFNTSRFASSPARFWLVYF
jgi:hypothetical protein